MSKVSRRTISEAVAAHMHFTDVRKDEVYQRKRDEYIRSVASYLMETKRTRELDSILRDISAEWARVGYVEVIARAAHPLTAEVKVDITDRIKALYPKAEKIVVTEVADPSVVGGVRLDLADKLLDLTVKAKLHKFKQLTGAGKE